MAWTERGDETDAFLALDHNANGIVDDGSELFGNASICGRRNTFKNGFEVLRYLDTPGMGGNFDGVIDASDAIFPQLLLWVDRNHNGFSEPEELLKFSDRFQASNGPMQNRDAATATATSSDGEQTPILRTVR